MSLFAWKLNRGELSIKYSRTRFYMQIRHTLLTLGLVGIQQRFIDSFELDKEELSPERKHHKKVVDKYVPVRQPVPKHPPEGLNLVRLTWILCTKWNSEFFKE